MFQKRCYISQVLFTVFHYGIAADDVIEKRETCEITPKDIQRAELNWG